MCTTADSGDIIILSDDDDGDEACEQDISVFIVEKEDVKNSDCVLPVTSLDEDLVVTFSRRAEVLPHARYDCSIHPFTATDHETSSPLAGNLLICDQCFCYICDKLASSCTMWSLSGVCHCNSHKKSAFWMTLRDNALLGGLKAFKLTLCEIDPHLRYAEAMLVSFRTNISMRFSSFLEGKRMEDYDPRLQNLKGVIYDYTPVYECVSSFLNKADEQEERAAAIMRLGAAENFIQHCHVAGTVTLKSPTANVAEAKVVLLQRVVTALQKQIVFAGFPSEFIYKLQDFYQGFRFPPEVKSMRDSLCVRPWSDVLLVSVLKGQNVLGYRKHKGRKDVLYEPIYVVLLRTEVLQRQQRYRELWRYLRAVETDDPARLGELRELIPFFKCLEGELSLALYNLFLTGNSLASRFTPHLFLFYFRIFDTATAPRPVVSQVSQLCISDATWETIKDTAPLKRADLVKFALRTHRCSLAVYTDSQCWTHLLKVLNTACRSSTSLPSPQFLHETTDVVTSFLHKEHGSNMQIPRVLQMIHPDQALLLLVTGALGLRLLQAAMCPVLPVLYTFKENVWALRWLWDNLSPDSGRFSSLVQEIEQEMKTITDGDVSLTFLQSIVPTLFSSSPARNWDHVC